MLQYYKDDLIVCLDSFVGKSTFVYFSSFLERESYAHIIAYVFENELV